MTRRRFQKGRGMPKLEPLVTPPSAPDDDNGGNGNGGNGGDGGPVGAQLPEWIYAPALPDPYDIDEEWEGPGQWGGELYNVNYPEEPPELAEVLSWSEADQLAFWTELANTQTGGNGTAALNIPTPAPGSGIAPLHEVSWKEHTFDVPGGNPPDWWVGLLPTNNADAERADVQALMMLNTLIPYLSPEDQKRAASQLYTTAADAFSYYKPNVIEATSVPVDMTTARLSSQDLSVIDTDWYSGTERAEGITNILSQMREATVEGNRWQLGPGYTWLQSIAGALEEHSPDEGGMTRSGYQAFLGALDPIMGMGGTQEIGPVAALGQMLAQPFFSQTQLQPSSQDITGQRRFGRANRMFF